MVLVRPMSDGNEITTKALSAYSVSWPTVTHVVSHKLHRAVETNLGMA
jgi:hypothetical protein